jgi:hypothetical protein
VFRVRLAAAKIHASGLVALMRPMFGQAVPRMLAAREFRADTRAQKGEERDEQQQRHPGD